MPPCAEATQTGCVVSFRTFSTGGDPSAFLHAPPPRGVGGRRREEEVAPEVELDEEVGLDEEVVSDEEGVALEVPIEVPICVNPLSWALGNNR